MTTVNRVSIRPDQADTTSSPRMSKRQRLASIMASTGGIRLLERLPQRNCLVVLNYHRIGSARNTLGDPNLFSASPDDFDNQVRWLKRHYHISSLDEAIAFVEGRETFRKTGVLLTFDDGYRDNYEYAFPILHKHKAQGTFFICTSYIASSKLPWWDEIASMLKTSSRSELTLHYPERMSFTLGGDRIEVLNQLLSIYKTRDDLDKNRFLDEIGVAAGTGRIGAGERLFIDLQELKEMAGHGMAVGSHTHSHPLLSHLTKEKQLQELSLSKQLLEEQLGIDIESLAYPVGAPDSFNEATREAARMAGYRVAFSFYGGSNITGRTDRFDVRRYHIGHSDGEALFRARASTAALLGKPLF